MNVRTYRSGDLVIIILLCVCVAFWAHRLQEVEARTQPDQLGHCTTDQIISMGANGFVCDSLGFETMNMFNIGAAVGITSDGLTTTWESIFIAGARPVRIIVQGGFAPFRTGASHSFVVYAESGCTTGNLEVRLQDATNTQTLFTVVESTGAAQFIDDTSAGTLPGGNANVDLEWRCSVGVDATDSIFYSANWSVK